MLAAGQLTKKIICRLPAVYSNSFPGACEKYTSRGEGRSLGTAKTKLGRIMYKGYYTESKRGWEINVHNELEDMETQEKLDGSCLKSSSVLRKLL